ncbi:hypothetical protein Egran_00310 [Elaphomyces granulatus]|uniref:EKC/KEOPS complex subunit GON7 n=1 Tax=Elaphomyces granulatus TaxID=519963 RepID=A0A232M6B3_9EURO|nr:hypothetical protein Egran_00310 [Elaphomyces granulatus]
MAPISRSTLEDSNPVLKAVYTSSHSPTFHTFHHPVLSSLMAATSSEVEATRTKTAYLAELKGLVTEIQGEINLFLTERMEEDKKALAVLGSTEQEVKEEANYGEDVMDDDA